MVLQGDSIRLRVHFKTFEGVSVNPNTITLNIYKNDQTLLISIPETELVNEVTGRYYFDYLVPDDLKDSFIFEFKGIHNNKPILSREKVSIQFTK